MKDSPSPEQTSPNPSPFFSRVWNGEFCTALRAHRGLVLVLALCFLLAAACQLGLIKTYHGRNLSDAHVYRTWGYQTAEYRSFYPDGDDVYSPYIFNPGYVNYLSVFFRHTKNDKIVMLANVVLNAMLGFFVLYIGYKLFRSMRVGLMAAILFFLFPAFSAEVALLRSELLFTMLAFGALAVFLSGWKFRYMLAGLLLGLANFVRPVAIVFLLPICGWALLRSIPLRRFAWLPACMVAVTLLFGWVSYRHSGYFVYQSTTGGVNLLMGANDDANGGYSSEVFAEGKAGYIPAWEEVTFAEKDAFWRAQAIDWIKEHPFRFLQLVPRKLFYTYATDTYSFSPLFDNQVSTESREYVIGLLDTLLHLRLGELRWQDVVVMVNQILYMLFWALSLFAAIRMLVRKRFRDALLLLGSIVVLGMGITALTSGGARYHFPYLPVLILLSAYGLSTLRFGKRSAVKPAE